MTAKKKKDARKKAAPVQAEDLMLAIVRQVPRHGWSEAALRAGAEAVGAEAVGAEAVGAAPGAVYLHFPRGVRDVVAAFSAWADRRMLAAIKKAANFTRWRVRDKIAFGVQARLEALAPYRDAVRGLLPWAAVPLHAPFALRQAYDTTDAMWRAAGDTSTDFNFYTKRGLLVFVLKTTTFFWLDDASKGQAETWKFLERRIAEVLKVGQKAAALRELNIGALAASIIKRAA
ncbi:MAG: COQ9 family protein [Alphaproteobacteria bacterium]|nr:COQ9 family protein [Alphaproteobacteria bacterium]